MTPPATRTALMAAAVTFDLPVGSDGTAPDWIHVLPAGTFRGSDGRGPYRVPDVGALITASMARGKLPVDENHSTDLAAPAGSPSPARGWIVELQSRDDGIWGRVEWAPSGTALLSERAYRGISPVFTHKDGVVTGILRASLTNTPNLAQLTTLHAHSGATMDLDLSPLRTALALSADATPDAVLAAAVETLGRRTESSVELQAQRTQMVSMQAELNTLREVAAREKATAVVHAAIRAGTPIPKPLIDHYIARHMTDAAGVELELNALPRMSPGQMQPPAGAAESGVDPETLMSEEDEAMCARTGVSREAFMKNRKAEMAARPKDV